MISEKPIPAKKTPTARTRRLRTHTGRRCLDKMTHSLVKMMYTSNDYLNTN